MEPTEVSFGNPQESAETLCQIFTIGKEGIKSYQYNLTGDRPPIPNEEKIVAETGFEDIYDKRRNKKRVLRIDLFLDDVTNISTTIFNIVTAYNERFYSSPDGSEAKKDLQVKINLLSENVRGAVRIPFENLLAPTQNLRNFLENLPGVLERRTIRNLLRGAFEESKDKSDFLKRLYERDDDGAKELVLEFIESAYDRNFFKKLSAEGYEYFYKLFKRLYERLTGLREHFSFPVSLLDLTEKGLEDRIREIPATPNDLFIPLITMGEEAEEREIPLSSIITAEAKETGTKGDNWLDYLIRRGGNYMQRFIRACLSGKLNLVNPKFDEGYILLHLGNGYYMVLNGRHRTVAAKLLGLPSIRATVYDLLPKRGEIREIFTQDLREIIKRVNSGLIKGKVFWREGRCFLEVENFEGPWVFYENMEGAKKFFEQSNSSVSQKNRLVIDGQGSDTPSNLNHKEYQIL